MSHTTTITTAPDNNYNLAIRDTLLAKRYGEHQHDPLIYFNNPAEILRVAAMIANESNVTLQQFDPAFADADNRPAHAERFYIV